MRGTIMPYRGGMPKFTDEQAEDIRKYYETGATLDEVGTKFNITRQTAKKYVEQAGGTIRKIGPAKGTTGKLRGPRSIEDLQTEILRILPNATFSKNHSGEIIIHTGVKTTMVEVL